MIRFYLAYQFWKFSLVEELPGGKTCSIHISDAEPTVVFEASVIIEFGNLTVNALAPLDWVHNDSAEHCDTSEQVDTHRKKKTTKFIFQKLAQLLPTMAQQ